MKDWNPFCYAGIPLPWSTHHTNGEIVVHDVIWDLVPMLHLLFGDDFQVPAVQHHQGTLLNVLQDFCQAAPFVTWGTRNRICLKAESSVDVDAEAFVSAGNPVDICD